MTATLIAHCGSNLVSRIALDRTQCPEPTATWFPVGHGQVVTMVHDALAGKGFTIKKEQYALTRQSDARLFATLDLEAPLAPGVGLSVGIRNSVDRSLPFGFCAGNRVFVCDNLSFKANLVVARKHTRNGLERYREAIALAVASLIEFRDVEAKRIEVLSGTGCTDDRAAGVILRSFEQGLVSSRALPGVIQEWREPMAKERRPDWKLIADQMRLYGFKDGLSLNAIEREVKTELRKMKEQYRTTGTLPPGWEDCIR